MPNACICFASWSVALAAKPVCAGPHPPHLHGLQAPPLLIVAHAVQVSKEGVVAAAAGRRHGSLLRRCRSRGACLLRLVAQHPAGGPRAEAVALQACLCWGGGWGVNRG